MSRSEEMQRQWAFEGAAVRLERLRAEIAQILQAFPELRARKARQPIVAATPAGGRYKGKRKISIAGRKAVSEGMRKYWARRKAQAKAGQPRASQAR